MPKGEWASTPKQVEAWLARVGVDGPGCTYSVDHSADAIDPMVTMAVEEGDIMWSPLLKAAMSPQ